MAYTAINIGTAANDGTGESNRSAFNKCNTMLSELYSTKAEVSSVTTAQSTANTAVTNAATAQAGVDLAKSGGLMYLSAASASVTIGTAGTFVGIGGLTDFTGSGLTNFTLTNDGTNQVLEYTGATMLVNVSIDFTVTFVAAASSKDLEARVSVGGSVSTIPGPQSHSSTKSSVTYHWRGNIATGARIKPVVTNVTDTTGITVHRAILRIAP